MFVVRQLFDQQDFNVRPSAHYKSCSIIEKSFGKIFTKEYSEEPKAPSFCQGQSSDARLDDVG
jgi:hypothetical protein